MEELKKRTSVETSDKEIVFSRAIKAGKRIYYLDVKKNRKEEMFLTITESKKVIVGEGDDSQVNFEKHKIFLYKEDFEKFMHGLNQTIQFINNNEENGHTEEIEQPNTSSSSALDEEIKIDIDF
ncbi:MAG: PUR family DNA/RNA-binding protein [Bacteroides sp.]